MRPNRGAALCLDSDVSRGVPHQQQIGHVGTTLLSCLCIHPKRPLSFSTESTNHYHADAHPLSNRKMQAHCTVLLYLRSGNSQGDDSHVGSTLAYQQSEMDPIHERMLVAITVGKRVIGGLREQ